VRGQAEDLAIEARGLVEVADGDPDVGDPRVRGDGRWEHSEQSTMEREPMAGSNLVEATDTSFPAEVEQHKGLTVVDFWAEWCGPCKMIAPILDQLASEYGAKGLKVVKVDVDSNNATAMRFNVRSIPTLLFFKDGRPVDSVVGAQPKQKLAERIDRHLAA
jgi:thioredoxin 1